MIKSNKFFVKNLKQVVFIGYSPMLEECININSKLGISSAIITSTDQSKNISHEHLIFDKADKNYLIIFQKTTI